MATDRRFTGRGVAALIVTVALLAPAVAAWLDPALLGGLDGAAVVRFVGLAVVLALVARWLFRRRGRNRGGSSDGEPPRGPGDDLEAGEGDDRTTGRTADIEGTGNEYLSYVYNSQVEATREGDRITEEAERLAEADRDARRRR